MQKPENRLPERVEDNPPQKSESIPPPTVENNQPQKAENGSLQKRKNNRPQKAENNRRDELRVKPEDLGKQCPGSYMGNVCAPQYSAPYDPPKWTPQIQQGFKDIPWLSNPKFEIRPNGMILHF